MRTISELVIHHSAGKHGTVEEFRAEHKIRLHAVDIGYHNVIGNGNGIADGIIADGRSHKIQGAGVFGNNEGKLHVCLVGCFEKGHPECVGEPTYKQYCSLGHWLLMNAKRYGPLAKKPLPKIAGHREITIPGHGTACPGNLIDLSRIRRWFAGAYPKFTSGQPFILLGDYLEAKLEESTPAPTPIPAQSSTVKLVIASTMQNAGIVDREVNLAAAYIDGRAFVRLDDLARILGWPEPTFDTVTKIASVRTR